MDPRPEFHRVLKALFDKDPHVYFQPPDNTRLSYPCIVYKLAGIPSRYADNRCYWRKRTYQVTVIDRNPDSPLREKLLGVMTPDADRDPEWNPFSFERDYDLQLILLRILKTDGRLFFGSFERSYVSENLNHFVFRITY